MLSFSWNLLRNYFSILKKKLKRFHFFNTLRTKIPYFLRLKKGNLKNITKLVYGIIDYRLSHKRPSLSHGKLQVLFISSASGPDYLCDMVYHGLKTIPFIHLEEINIPAYMYANYKKDLSLLYGRGFTIYGKLLSDPNLVDFFSAKSRIKNRKYDLIIFGSICRYDLLFEQAISYYPREKVLVIDGEDNQNIELRYASQATYFKRELTLAPSTYLKSINFAIPQDLILKEVPKKAKIIASIIPGNLATYNFKNEIDYFRDYQLSVFGLTYKKGGWDCLRHYEILMNGCIPYFRDLHLCPENTMPFFPKKIILESNSYFHDYEANKKILENLTSELLEFTHKKLTTGRLAQYLISGDN